MATTYADVLRNPALMLLSTAAEFRGDQIYRFTCAALFVRSEEDNAYFVASPNCSTLPIFPLQHPRKIRLKRDLFFGLDDPCTNPQPLDMNAAHLATIPKPTYPGLSDVFRLAYLDSGTRGYFEVQDFTSGLGTFRYAWQEYRQLGAEMEQEITSADALHQALDMVDPKLPSKDPFVKGYRATALSLISRLRLPSTEKESLLLIKCLQRTFLELKGRLLWLTVYFPKGRSLHNPPPLNCDPLVGAYVSDFSLMRRLLISGIPCYLVESITPGKKREIFSHHVEQVVSGRHDCLPLQQLDASLEEAEPPFEIIWTGAFSDLGRYRSMRLWLAKQHQPIGAAKPTHSPDEARVPEVPEQSRSDLKGGASRVNRFRPYPQRPATPSPSSNKAVNTWIPTCSELMPEPLPNWLGALNACSGLNLSAYPLDGLNPGYAVPDANLIARASPLLQPIYIHTWLQIRQVMLYRLTSSHASSPLANKTWKTILGKHKVNATRPFTKRGQEIAATAQTLDDIIQISPLSASTTAAQLYEGPAVWKGIPVGNDQLPPQRAVQEILWELAEINFRNDFLTLDELETDDVPDRREQVEEMCWPDPPSHPRAEEAEDSLASSDNLRRRSRLKGFFSVVQRWKCARSWRVFGEPFPRLEDQKLLEDVERAIAHCYVKRFYDYFKRPAGIPYKFPPH